MCLWPIISMYTISKSYLYVIITFLCTCDDPQTDIHHSHTPKCLFIKFWNEKSLSHLHMSFIASENIAYGHHPVTVHYFDLKWVSFTSTVQNIIPNKATPISMSISNFTTSVFLLFYYYFCFLYPDSPPYNIIQRPLALLVSTILGLKQNYNTTPS